jgi:hypothetical protein
MMVMTMMKSMMMVFVMTMVMMVTMMMMSFHNDNSRIRRRISNGRIHRSHWHYSRNYPRHNTRRIDWIYGHARHHTRRVYRWNSRVGYIASRRVSVRVIVDDSYTPLQECNAKA